MFTNSDNVTGADNQQERLTVEAIPRQLGSFLSGFALGEASFMLVCRRRDDYGRKWRVSAAFNVSQKDRAPLELFRDTLGCGTIRKAGDDGWYFEVNRLGDLVDAVVPFFDRFPLVGRKQHDLRLFCEAVALLAAGTKSDADYIAVLALREQMNGGGNRRHTTARILRDYTPTSRSSGEMR
jgi:LAGLIDADG DNA endonuclease family protein